jgi:flagellar protein FlaG
MSLSEIIPISGSIIPGREIGENRTDQKQPANEPKSAAVSEKSAMKKSPNGMNAVQEIGGANFEEIIAKINRELDLQRVAREFRIDETLGKTVVRLYDKETGDLIREVPPEQLAKLSRQARELIGILMELKA